MTEASKKPAPVLHRQWDQTTSRLIDARPKQLKTVFANLHQLSRNVILARLPRNERVLTGFNGMLHSPNDVGMDRVGPEIGIFDVIITTTQLILIGIIGRSREPIWENRSLEDFSRVSGQELRGALRKKFFVIRVTETDGCPLLISAGTIETGRAAGAVLFKALKDFRATGP
jgi:hypothetical protein